MTRGARKPLNSLCTRVAIGHPGLAENERRIVLSDRIQIFVALDFAFGRAVESGSDKAGEHRAAFLGIGFAANACVSGNRIDRRDILLGKGVADQLDADLFVHRTERAFRLRAAAARPEPKPLQIHDLARFRRQAPRPAFLPVGNERDGCNCDDGGSGETRDRNQRRASARETVSRRCGTSARPAR